MKKPNISGPTPEIWQACKINFYQCLKCTVSWLILVTVACQFSFMEVNMLISFKQRTSAAKVVQEYISKLNTEMIDRFRHIKKSPSTETTGRYRKFSHIRQAYPFV